MRLVIVGGVAAGTKAASRARRLDPEMEITVYQEEPEPSISECGLPYLLSGVVEERDDLVARGPSSPPSQAPSSKASSSSASLRIPMRYVDTSRSSPPARRR